MAQNRDQSNKRRKPAETRQGRSSQKPRKPQTTGAARNSKTSSRTSQSSSRSSQNSPKTKKPQNSQTTQRTRTPGNSRPPQRTPTPRKSQPPKSTRPARSTPPPQKKKQTRNPRPQPQKKGGGVLSLRLVVVLEVLAVLVLAVLLLMNRKPGGQEQIQDPTKGTVQTDPIQTAPPATTPPTDPPTVPPTVPPTEPPKATDPTVPKETEPVYVPEAEDADAPATVIHVAAAGDLNINDATVSAGKKGGTYDYTDVFMDVAPVFAGADLALLNFEGNLVGTPYGTESVSAPQALAEALDAMGVDLVQSANSYSVTHGIKGLSTTLNSLREAGLTPLGAFASGEEFQETKGYTIVNVKGIRIAFVAFTKGVGGLSLPAGSEDCVNLLYEDYATTYQKIDTEGIKAVLSNVSAEKPDITIAMVHWGSEYKDSVTKNQEKIAKTLQEGGVNVILGTHSHMLHQINFDPVTGQMVAYSLGDFFGDAQRAGTEYSVILDLEITRDNTTGQTRVTNYSYTPIYTLTGEDSADGQTRVVRLKQAMAAYDENFVGKVSQSVYESMEHAAKRIDERINPKKAEEEKK